MLTLTRPDTLAAYFEQEEKSEEKHEYINPLPITIAPTNLLTTAPLTVFKNISSLPKIVSISSIFIGKAIAGFLPPTIKKAQFN